MRVALDTNILAYAEGLGDEPRCSMAVQLVEQLHCAEVVLPAQTLGELSRVLTGKAKRTPSQAREAVLGWADSFEVADSTWFAFQAALDLTVDHQLPMWDALILAVAAENHCRLLLSEDFHNGFTWRGVTVVNPFAEPRAPLLTGLLRASN
ncbi:MAG: VapC toxin family PIN domain ribonuclease [Betaproteobacteria bacterium HGW-Betaproteobacteria-10]|jgi:predicted nucleic acid-binding protein|nr:MAG: VapC toxin family PIN domain ribonuclease [Betaproteobacteria bacterium HGW-Betaproteobacteria-10]